MKPGSSAAMMSGSLVTLLSDRISPALPISIAPLSMGILQARILEWVAMSSSRGTFPTQGLSPGLPHCILYCLSHQGSPNFLLDESTKLLLKSLQ